MADASDLMDLDGVSTPEILDMVQIAHVPFHGERMCA